MFGGGQTPPGAPAMVVGSTTTAGSMEDKLKPKILVAISLNAGRRILHPLAGEFDLHYCRSAVETHAPLASGMDAVVCGINFDGGRLFDFLARLRNDPAGRVLPFICLRQYAESPHLLHAVEMIRHAVEVGGGSFIDVSRLRATGGDAVASAALRGAILDALATARPASHAG